MKDLYARACVCAVLCVSAIPAMGDGLVHQWARLGELFYLDNLNQIIEGPRIRAWIRGGHEHAMMNFVYQIEVNCVSGTMRYLVHQQYQFGVPGAVEQREDTPEEGIGFRILPIYHMLCEKVERASAGKYITATPRKVELQSLPEPSKESGAWVFIAQDESGATSLDVGTLVSSGREFLGWLRSEMSTLPPTTVYTFHQFDCVNNRMRALGIGAETQPMRLASAGNWKTMKDQGRGIIQSVCGKFDELLRQAQALKHAPTKKEVPSKGTLTM